MKTDLELYRIFVTVAQEGSFSGAAKVLYLTQPAVSQAVHKLEAQLNAVLFVRGRRGSSLTQEGRLIYERALSALQILESGEQQLRRLQTLEEGRLRLGAADTITKEYLLPYLSAFRQLHPGIHLQVTNRTSRQLTKLLDQGQLDIAVVNLPIENRNLMTQPLFTVHDIFVAGHRFDSLQGQHLSPAALAQHPLVMLEQAANSRIYVDRYFTRYGVTLAPEIELGAHELLPSFAAIGFGLACVVEEFCRKELEEDVVFPVPLNPPIPPRSIGACWAGEFPLSAPAKELLRLLRANDAE